MYVLINHPFKTALPHWDNDFGINNKNTCKPNESDIIEAVFKYDIMKKALPLIQLLILL